MTANNSTELNDLLVVGITGTPTTPVTEDSGVPEVFTISLSEPAPEGGLQLNLISFDTDGVEGDEELTTGDITDMQDVPNGAGTGSILTNVTVAEGAKEAQFILTPIEDENFEGPETNYFFLQPGDGYTVDPNNSFATTTLIDAPTSLPIENHSFEEPALEDGEFTELEAIPGWELYDPKGLITGDPVIPGDDAFTDVGAYNPLTGQHPDEAPEGENAGYAFAVDPFGSGVLGLSQTIDTLLAPNTKYTLEVEVGNPKGIDQVGNNYAGFPGYRVELLAGDTVLASEQNNLFIEEGTFETSTVAFTATADSLYLGENLGIRLVNILEGPGLEVDFDAVHLTAQTLPDLFA